MGFLAPHVSFQVLQHIGSLTARQKKYKGFTSWQRKGVFSLLLWLWKVFPAPCSTLTPCLLFSILPFTIELLQKHRLRGIGPASDLSDTRINLGCCSQLVWKYLKSACTASVPSRKGAYDLGWRNSRTKATSTWCGYLRISPVTKCFCNIHALPVTTRVSHKWAPGKSKECTRTQLVSRLKKRTKF